MADSIRDLLLQLTDNGEQQYCVLGKVTKVDKTKNTCDVEPLTGEADLMGIRLQAGAGKGIVTYPKVDSVVIVSYLNKDDGYVSMYSEIDVISIENAQTSLKKILKDLSKAVQMIKLTTPAGPSTGVINLPDFVQVDNLIDSLFK